MTKEVGSGESGGDAFDRAVRAVISGDLDALRAELDGADEDSGLPLVHRLSPAPFRAPLLHYAAAANGVEDDLQRTPPNAVEVVQLLLERGADPDALSSSYDGGPNATALCLLVSSWHPFEAGLQPALVRALVDGGAKVNGLEDDCMPLATALVFGYTGAAKALVEAGARVDSILLAAGLGRTQQVAEFFTEEGLDVKRAQGSFVSPLLGKRDLSAKELVQQALHFAVTHGEIETAALLLEKGAEANGVSQGHHCETPLLQALFVRELAAARWLVENGANPDLVDGKRKTSAREATDGEHK